jgi:hypothetical protein
METLKQIPPFFKPKSDEHYPTRQHWSPGEPYPRDREPNALEALERNAQAADEAIQREQIAAARRMRRVA